MLFVNENTHELNKWFDACFVITIEGCHYRQEWIKSQLAKINIKFDFFFGTDGNLINYKELQKYKPPTFDNVGQVGCCLSHYNCWEMCYKNKFKSVLIFEDDITVKEHAKETLYETMKQLPSNWTIFHLGTSYYKKGEVDRNHPKRKIVNDYIMIGDSEFEGSWAYAISDVGIDYLLKRFNKEKMPTDGMISWLTGHWNKENHAPLGVGYVATEQVFYHDTKFESEIYKRSRSKLIV